MDTPCGKLKSLPNAQAFLKPGITFEPLDAIALRISDNEAAKQMNEAKRQLFKTIFGQGRKAGCSVNVKEPTPRPSGCLA
jgi:hypothetical protein